MLFIVTAGLSTLLGGLILRLESWVGILAITLPSCFLSVQGLISVKNYLLAGDEIGVTPFRNIFRDKSKY